VIASCGNCGDGCEHVGKVLRVHALRPKPVLLVVEIQSTLHSLVARPQLACLRHHDMCATLTATIRGAPWTKHLLRPHQCLHQLVVGVVRAQLAGGSRSATIRIGLCVSLDSSLTLSAVQECEPLPVSRELCPHHNNPNCCVSLNFSPAPHPNHSVLPLTCVAAPCS
jgi:hypothetical protein